MFQVFAVRGRLDRGAWHLTPELGPDSNTVLVYCKHLATSTGEPRSHKVSVDVTKMYALLDADGEAEGVKGVAKCTLTPLVAAYSECPDTGRATVRLDAVNQTRHSALWIEIDMSRRHLHPSRALKRKAEEPADDQTVPSTARKVYKTLHVMIAEEANATPAQVELYARLVLSGGIDADTTTIECDGLCLPRAVMNAIALAQARVVTGQRGS